MLFYPHHNVIKCWCFEESGVDALKNAGVVKKKTKKTKKIYTKQKYASVKMAPFVNCVSCMTQMHFHSKIVKLWLNITAHTGVHNANIKNNLVHAIATRHVVVFV